MIKKVDIMNPKIKPDNRDDWVNVRSGQKRFTINMPVALHTRLKIVSAKLGESMADITCKILEEKIQEYENK